MLIGEPSQPETLRKIESDNSVNKGLFKGTELDLCFITFMQSFIVSFIRYHIVDRETEIENHMFEPNDETRLAKAVQVHDANKNVMYFA